MRKSIRALGLVLAIAAGARCASVGAPGFGDPRHDLITSDQIRGGSVSDPYELIQKLRPFWIARGGNNTPQNPGRIYVYLDGSRMGGLEALRMIPLAGIEYIRWYDGTQAASRWGLDHERGVIFVSTQPLRP